MLVKQIRVGVLDNFSYLVSCEKTKEALVIDPAGNIDPIMNEVKNLDLTVKYIVNTHGHGDHTAGNAQLKISTGATIVMHKLDADRYSDVDLIIDKEKLLRIGEITFKIIHTPGHTPGGMCLYTEGQLFTGDTLFVGDSGRTDLPGGNRPILGAFIRKLMQLPDDTIVWPGHDYGPTPHSTIGWEKQHNVNAKEYGFYKNG